MKHRDIPSVHELLETPEFKQLLNQFPRSLVKSALTAVLNKIRSAADKYPEESISPTALMIKVQHFLKQESMPSLHRLINATGTVLHTNLGRSPLPETAIESIAKIARGYCNLEMDTETGERGHRSDHVESLICELTGAEAAFVVNNNAGAVMLVLAAVAGNREVLVSRGELIEIGGGFRIPEVMAFSGAHLKEVGTTNRTHLSDFAKAITPDTGLIFKAAYSNFAMVGFTSSVPMIELIELAHKSNIPLMYDLGSGCLFEDLPAHWQSVSIQSCCRSGADIVSFSGDKLLGGPQAGIIVGRRDLIQRISRHPFARALRIDKLTLAGLEAVLNHYKAPDAVSDTLPVLRMLTQSEECLQKRARRLAGKIKRLKIPGLNVSIGRSVSAVGGGSLPLVELPTWSIQLTHSSDTSLTLASKLRRMQTPIIPRIKDDYVVMDLRTILECDESLLIDSISELPHIR